VAAAAAVAITLVGTAVLISDHNAPFTGKLTGTAAPADISATHRSPATTAPKAIPDPVLSVPQVSGLVTPGIVVINAELGFQNAEAAGTGMILSSTGEILTNNHVISGSTKITVTVISTRQQYGAVVVGTSAANDVAVLQLRSASGLPTIPLGDSDTATIGQPVVAIGNAGGRGMLSVVTGTITSTSRNITATDSSGSSSERLTGMIEVQASIKAGDSGGPLASRAGKVIGMDTAASSFSDQSAGRPTYGFAIPINRALAIASTIRSGGSESGVHLGGRGYLGIRVSGNPRPDGGAAIVATTPDSPAAGAGLQPGDVVTSLNDRPVTSADGLTESLAATHPGEQVTLSWTDPLGEVHTAVVTLGQGPAD
jgi:S1-C subfamily serine protease